MDHGDVAQRHRRALGIEGDTCEAEIRRRHRALLRRCHPDLAPRSREREFLEKAKRVNVARDWLLEHPSCWVQERPHPAVAVRPPIPACRPADTRNETPQVRPSAMKKRGRGGDALGGATRAVVLLIEAAVILYFALLAFAIAGWVITTLMSR
jgi:hypothetical protein